MMSWKGAVAEHRKPTSRRSVWQIVNTLASYVALWGLMIWTIHISYWVTLALAVVAAGFLARTFIIFHDCGHGAFFESRRANDLLGFVTGVLTFTPYRQWRHLHALHHATSGDLDRRGPGDIWTLTVQEYLEASRAKRFWYRLARNPFVLFVLARFYVFLIQQRFPSRSVFLGLLQRRLDLQRPHEVDPCALAVTELQPRQPAVVVRLRVQGVACGESPLMD